MVRKLFRQMSAVQIVSSATVLACLLIDSFVIGRLIGSDALSAYGLANPVLIISVALGNMMICGVQVVFGKHMGRGDTKGMNTCFSSSLLMALGLAALELLVIFTASKPICRLLGAGEDSAANPVFRMTEDYLRGYYAGVPFFFLYEIMIPYLQMLGKRRMVYLSVTVMTLCNTLFDFLNVHVFHGGMFGIALATGMGYFAAVSVSLAFFLKKDCPVRFSLRSLGWSSAKSILKGGGSMIVGDICFVLNAYCYNRILLDISGKSAVAAYSVMTTLTNLIFCIGLGIGSVTLTLSSVFYGDRDRSSLREVVREMVSLSLLLMSSAVLFTGVFAPQLVSLFVRDDPLTASIAVSGLRLLSLSLLPGILSSGFRSLNQGIHRAGTANLIVFLRFIFPTIPLAFLMGRLFGLNGVWLGTVTGEVIALAVIAAIAWRFCGRISFTADTFCFLGHDTDAQTGICLDMTMRTISEVADSSRALVTFCTARGMDRRTSVLIGLCMEEIAVNIIRHGFSKDRRPHSVDARLVIEGERTILHIRDNCVNFDPVKYIELHRQDDPVAHIGLRMVMGMVKEASYVNSLGLNNLTLVL